MAHVIRCFLRRERLTSNLDHLFLDLAQTENVLGGENGSVVDKSVINACHVTRTQHETHGTFLNAEMSQVNVDRSRPLISTTIQFNSIQFNAIIFNIRSKTDEQPA